jgi:hypothetical protein
MATVLHFRNLWRESTYPAELPVRFRYFVWLSTGMFSAGALAVAFLGYLWTGAFEAASSNVFASILSGALFGLSNVLRFGPNEA